MCTSLSLPTSDGRNLFGRTLDLDTHFGEAVTFTPRGYRFSHGGGSPKPSRYALLGTANLTDGYPLYAEAMNEAGLCMAGLRFAMSAAYAAPSAVVPAEGMVELAPWELIPYLLGSCATATEARALLERVTVVNKPFSPTLPAAPLHWHIADREPSREGAILEVTSEGMRLYTDEVGVLTNEPPYPAQLASLRACKDLQGDAPGLPGDYSSPSRFVRAAALRQWAVEWMAGEDVAETECCAKADAAVSRFFSILGAVSPTAGAVLTQSGTCHRTLYTCCMDGQAGVYRWKTEEEAVVRSAAFQELDVDGETVLSLSCPVFDR